MSPITTEFLVTPMLVTKSLAEATSKLADVGKMYNDDLPSPSSLQSEHGT